VQRSTDPGARERRPAGAPPGLNAPRAADVTGPRGWLSGRRSRGRGPALAPRQSGADQARLPRVSHAATGSGVDATPVAKPARAIPGRLQRYRALIDLCTRQLRGLVGVRVGWALGWLIGSGFAIAILAASGAASQSAVQDLVVRSLSWLSWLAAGVTVLSAAQDLQARDKLAGINVLVQQRGYDLRALAAARVLATIRVVLRSTAPPALLLALLALALAEAWSVAAARVLLTLGVAAYVVVLAVVLGATARWASALSPRRGRSVAVVLLLGPHWARSVWPSMPSVPAWFEALLEQLQQVGSSLG
jgi:hypothetical protein